MKKKSALLIMILFISTFSYGRINNNANQGLK